MDIFQIIFGRFVVELIGASIRYVVANIINKIKGKDFKPFSKFWTPDGSKYKKLETESANRIAALFVFVILLVLIFHFGQ
ncbi:hypothetical protein HME9304_02737 [Flagellimonas maritima]|uniref:Uncharacterized protein n=1 Tax=Flagellimonas maritima TaxID=1383885 RepID=A0A2Z4LVH8_9FLAO|nr:hypothetical protein [Allomuricauda aurantiaca]AWX45710.1 hypothetical protein HME9304_02737 [Allomuricauda aurantiaca]